MRGALRYYDGDVVVLDEGGGLESEGVEICTFSSGTTPRFKAQHTPAGRLIPVEQGSCLLAVRVFFTPLVCLSPVHLALVSVHPVSLLL